MEDVILLHISPVPFFLAFDYSLRERAVNGKNNIILSNFIRDENGKIIINCTYYNFFFYVTN